MYELVDENKNIKMMALIICTFIYGNNDYCLYSIDKDNEEDYIFVSKLVQNSQGYTLDNNFTSGEKEALDDIITSLLNKENIDVLKEKGFSFTDIKLNGICKFNDKICYITTYKKGLLKECMLNYNIDIPNNNTPIIKVKKIKPVNKGNYEKIVLLVLGIITLVVSLLAIIKIIF